MKKVLALGLVATLAIALTGCTDSDTPNPSPSASGLRHVRVAALPIAETVKRVRDGLVEATLDRRVLWAVQTPQAFRADLLREAHDTARRDGAEATDDAMLVERLGHRVRVVPGLSGNVKITTPNDLRAARGAVRR